MQQINHTACYEAIKARDLRFDGQFFTAVRTTKIYCRPICPAPTPKSENCTFYSCAAVAQSAGFRPCLRCRPELAPHTFETNDLVNRALEKIAAGKLDDGNLDQLADGLGLTERHLRRLFQSQLGVSPSVVAQTRRILFAKQLIDETQLSFTDVALAAGFSSIRRFNEVMLQTYQQTPSQLRHHLPNAKSSTSAITLRLPFYPPYNWTTLVRFLAARLIKGVEVVGENYEYYRRTICLEGTVGMIEVRPAQADQNYLLATVYFPKVALLGQIVERLRTVFDLNCNPSRIAAHFENDAYLGNTVKRLPGLRLPGAWDKFETSVRAILGQQISVAAATTLAGRIAQKHGTPLIADYLPKDSGLTHVFPTPQVLAHADLSGLGIVQARINAIQALATTLVSEPQLLDSFRNLAEAVKRLCELRGIGEWTAQYIAMRALHEPDAFPTADLGLMRAISRETTAVELNRLSENWRPWRAYAAIYLWNKE